MLEERIEYKDGQYDVVLTVRQATVLDGMERSAIVANMFAQNPHSADMTDIQRYRRVMLLQTYPACLAATNIESRGMKELSTDLTPEEFLGLPEVLVKQWEDTVFRLNGHWLFRAVVKEDATGEAHEPNDETG
jgi:hypothetical protein